jgi:hypothetical protein
MTDHFPLVVPGSKTAPIKSVSPVLNEFFKPKRVNIGKAKMPKQDPICGRIREKVT